MKKVIFKIVGETSRGTKLEFEFDNLRDAEICVRRLERVYKIHRKQEFGSNDIEFLNAVMIQYTNYRLVNFEIFAVEITPIEEYNLRDKEQEFIRWILEKTNHCSDSFSGYGFDSYENGVKDIAREILGKIKELQIN